MAGLNLDEKSVRRVGDATRKSESQRTDHTSPPTTRHHSQESLARFKLRTPLEQGKFAIGRKLKLERNDDGSYYWLQTDQEEPVFLATGLQTRLDAGAEVSALLTAAGFAVVSESLFGRIVSGTGRPIPYGVYPVAHGEQAGILWLGNHVENKLPWELDYGFVGDVPDDPPAQDAGPDGAPPKLWPCTVQLPTWTAYDLSPDTELPTEVLESLGWGNEHPEPGEYWGTRFGPKLLRTASLLELYWYKWTPPAPACNVNPEYDPDTNPDVPKGFWAGTTVECDPDDPGDPPDSALAEPVWWIAPVGWWGWGFGGWGWGWGWNGLAWNYPYWWGGVGSTYWWGGWGYGWWINRWGGRPPTAADLPDPDGPVPQPPSGQGEVTRECRYGWVVWDWGWRILNVDRDRQLAFIIGNIEFRNRLVVENPTPDDCPSTYAT